MWNQFLTGVTSSRRVACKSLTSTSSSARQSAITFGGTGFLFHKTTVNPLFQKLTVTSPFQPCLLSNPAQLRDRRPRRSNSIGSGHLFPGLRQEGQSVTKGVNQHVGIFWGTGNSIYHEICLLGFSKSDTKYL